ncbi:DUF4129 domain-containing protein [Maribacter algicola]|uniref:DUF4129 domain-containing protein n=1 Tax=Meishania litoralis TaxID=3434685 RepID=A0ACC7LSC1_9FLAO
MRKHFLLFLSLVLLVSVTVAQQDSTVTVKYDNGRLTVREIQEDDLQAYRNNPDFDYETIKRDRTWWDDFKTWFYNLISRFFEWLFGVEKAAGFLQVFFRILPYVLLALLLFILIKFFLNVNASTLKQAKKNEALVALSEEEHIIKNEDIQQLIQKALLDKDYRMAIRYYYLYILQLMTDNEVIAWELQKTNFDYLNEIDDQTLKQPFGVITRWYDYIWYGNFNIDEANYRIAEKDFESLQKTLKNG